MPLYDGVLPVSARRVAEDLLRAIAFRCAIDPEERTQLAGKANVFVRTVGRQIRHGLM